VLALAVVLAGVLGQLIANLGTAMFGALISAMTTGKNDGHGACSVLSPSFYGVAIAIRTFARVVLVTRDRATLSA
jgi:hypothetical protein